MIKLQVIGHLGRNAVQREANGKSVLGFSVAHTEKFKNQQGVQQERTTWVDCSLWERDNLAPYLTQGTQVFVEGTPALDTYVSNTTNEKIPVLRLRVTNIQLLGSRREEVARTEGVSQSGHTQAFTDDQPPDDLPF